jgi:two-component system, NtrC family, response regulator HydG
MARILVVDDEESIVYTFESFLSDEGHDVLIARDYNEALTRVSEAEVDLIFSDIILGGKTGIDLLRDVRALGLTCPVVMITGFPEIQSASDAVRLGAFDYVAKPVVQETLLRLTNVALQHKRALDEKEEYRSHLEAIFASVEDAIVTVDSDATVLEMNEAARALCGLGPEAIGQRLGDVLLSGKDGLLEALRETLTGRQSVRGRRLECRAEGRLSQVLSVSTYPLVSRQGRFLGAVLVARDETRLAGLEHDLDARRRFHNLVGISTVMQDLYALIEILADVETSVLITGESGTGKELVAEALHRQGARSSGPLVKVNCSALPENLLESELFGHVKGAFTGAASDRIGRFQRADRGTIVLDEIGDISQRMQLSLLRVLQDREFERVGDSRPIRVDVRVIASTNRNLAEKVARGEFREDLYYRLKVVEVSLPALRDRREDIPLLIEHFIAQLNRKLKRHIRGVSADVERLCMDYAWPGNVRELEHALEHACVLCLDDIICMDHLPAQLRALERARAAAPAVAKAGLDADVIREVLRKTAGNRTKAARLLGVDRKTLYRNITKHRITEDPPQA